MSGYALIAVGGNGVESQDAWDPSGCGNRIDDITLYEGIVQVFDLTSLDVPNDLLRRHLAKRIEDLVFLNPKKFEVLMRDVYSDCFDCEVRHVGGPGDNGIDLFAVINDEPHLVQVKRRSNGSSTESVSTVRELIGALISAGVIKGHLVTSARDFSEPARKLTTNVNVRRHNIHIELKAIGDIHDMISVSTPTIDKPWECCERGIDSPVGNRIDR
jgi:restriction endonuclease